MKNKFRIEFQKATNAVTLVERAHILNANNREITYKEHQGKTTVTLFCNKKDHSDRKEEIDYLRRVGFEQVIEE